MFGENVFAIASLRRFCYVNESMVSTNLLDVSITPAGLYLCLAIWALCPSIGKVLIEELLYDLVFWVVNQHLAINMSLSDS